ncbi:cell wall metabolism sensor histidine kinase WalK [Nocardioides sp. Arc9.136]|uniref:sensor histidine kinase n=1 Tax=Nocardioides sp. Arc9.136 TaxID=2996826 RepID=UPI00266518EB|nr:GAF domain-containing sensor histidine kinase [Nocardioides sp. Arc9.136]WKN48140.1 GAF domain-containing sensor histidine kinase [Nocardioides sp. Arc9.136]
MTNPATAATRPGPSGLSPEAQESLQLIAEGITAVAGFGVAAIGLVRDEHLEMVAVAGSPQARGELTGRRTPLHLLTTELEVADDWGLLKFVPHERLRSDVETWAWVPQIEVSDDAEAWHPLDMLTAPLLDDDGAMRGLVSIDVPDDGRRPGPTRRRLLERYAAQASRAVLRELEREELAEQVRLAETARKVVRRASRQRSLARILDESSEALVEGFRALGMWIQTFDEDGLGSGTVHALDGTEVELSAGIVEIAERSARLAWAAQRTVVVARGRLEDGLSEDEREQVVDLLDSIDVGSILFVPLGVGPECLGNLVLTRPHGGAWWSDTEADAALDIGRDLGTAILNLRAFEREHRLVQELQALDQYKGQLIATVAHELKNPLTSIVGYLEMLEGEGLDQGVEQALSAMDRGARRMVRVIDDLLLLSKVGDPANPVIPRPVDLRTVAADAVDLTTVAARQRDLEVRIDAPPYPVLASGDPDELDRVLSNLVSNAVKYTEPGRSVTVALARDGDEVVVECRDEGFGISAEDQERLFTEFFRSTNPVAVAQPGTGLGLAIVARIVERHGGRIEVESELGRGSTFRVRLPAA